MTVGELKSYLAGISDNDMELAIEMNDDILAIESIYEAHDDQVGDDVIMFRPEK